MDSCAAKQVQKNDRDLVKKYSFRLTRETLRRSVLSLLRRKKRKRWPVAKCFATYISETPHCIGYGTIRVSEFPKAKPKCLRVERLARRAKTGRRAAFGNGQECSIKRSADVSHKPSGRVRPLWLAGSLKQAKRLIGVAQLKSTTRLRRQPHCAFRGPAVATTVGDKAAPRVFQISSSAVDMPRM